MRELAVARSALREKYDAVMRTLTAGHPALDASGGRPLRWTCSLPPFLIAAGIGLLGLCAIAYVDLWAYQATERLMLSARASAGETRSAPGIHYARGQSMGWLEIPRLGVSVMVAHGDDTRTLLRAVGHIPGTAFPGEPGNVGLAGHRDTFFRALEGIETSDTIRLAIGDRVFSYRVVAIGIVSPSRVEVLDPTAAPSLTLVTCYPFGYVGSAPYRYVVRAQELRPDDDG